MVLAKLDSSPAQQPDFFHIRTEKQVIGLVLKVRLPPRWVMMRRERLRPIPLPDCRVVKNGVKICPAVYSDIGSPSLEILISTDSSAFSSASTVEYFMNLRNDVAFKIVFGTPQHARLLMRFLNTIFIGEKAITKIDFKAPSRS